MGSSEIVDSGRFSSGPVKTPVKSSFSQTCNLFSQYLKENNNFPDLSLGKFFILFMCLKYVKKLVKDLELKIYCFLIWVFDKDCVCMIFFG